MDDNIINLKLNEDGVYDITDDDITDNTEEVEYNELQQHTPVDDFVDGIFMGLNVSNVIHKVIRRII